jgi:hypothetical protein
MIGLHLVDVPFRLVDAFNESGLPVVSVDGSRTDSVRAKQAPGAHARCGVEGRSDDDE